MAWTLGLVRPKESVLLDRYFLAVGRSMCVAANFEEQCKFILQIGTVVHAYHDHVCVDAVTELLELLSKDKLMLGKTIRLLGAFPEFLQSEVDMLRAAKDARNYIAHEAGAMGPLHDVRAKLIEKKFACLLSQVEILASGENLAAKWCYEIDEKEPAPRSFQEEYVKRVLIGSASKPGSGISR